MVVLLPLESVSIHLNVFFFQTYNKTPSLIAYKSPEHMKEAIRTLNVLYVYDRSYEPYLIYWLFPLQIAFPSQQQGNKKDDRGRVYSVSYSN